VFDSIINMEKRNNSDRWYKKNDATVSSSVWREEDNKVMLLSEIAKKEEFKETDKYSTGIPMIDSATDGGVRD
jgi:hypothetical protein